MELETRIVCVGVFENVVDALGVKQGGTAFDTMYLIALFQQQF